MSKKKLSVVLPILMLGLAILGCSLTRLSSDTQSAIDEQVQIAQEVEAALQATQAAAQVDVAAPPNEPIQTPPADEPTTVPGLTPTPTTSSVPYISVSVSTNCRTGPGKVYDYVGALIVGEEAEIVAREATGYFWYIRNPDGFTEFCWVGNQYASIRGDTSALPVLTPPATPTPVSGSISGYVYIDGDNNNQRGDPADGSISGSILELIPGGCSGAVATTVESSSADGSYSFTGLTPGTYCVRPSQLQQTMDPLTRTVTVDPNEDLVEVNFRYLP